MSLKLKGHIKWLVTKTEIFKNSNVFLKSGNVIKTEILPKLKCHQNWYVTKTEMSPKLKCHQNCSFTKTELSPKLKCHQNWNITKAEMLQNIILSSIIKIKIPEMVLFYYKSAPIVIVCPRHGCYMPRALWIST